MGTPQIIKGPLTSKVSKQQAEAQLIRHPLFPKGASYTLDELEGHWIASFVVEAAPPDAFADGGGPGETPAGPPEPSEVPKGPDETPEDVPEDPSEDKPKGEKKEKGEKGELGEIKELLTLLVTALGLGGDANPVPGADEGPPSPPPMAPPDAPGGDNKTHTVHERALKPGEAPPGTTPIGSPSFASISDDHPWKPLLGVKKTFKVEEPIGADESVATVTAELRNLAAGTGYKIAQFKIDENESGQRIARALISQ